MGGGGALLRGGGAGLNVWRMLPVCSLPFCAQLRCKWRPYSPRRAPPIAHTPFPAAKPARPNPHALSFGARRRCVSEGRVLEGGTWRGVRRRLAGLTHLAQVGARLAGERGAAPDVAGARVRAVARPIATLRQDVGAVRARPRRAQPRRVNHVLAPIVRRRARARSRWPPRAPPPHPPRSAPGRHRRGISRPPASCPCATR
jgi:hypothetical protein